MRLRERGRESGLCARAVPGGVVCVCLVKLFLQHSSFPPPLTRALPLLYCMRAPPDRGGAIIVSGARGKIAKASSQPSRLSGPSHPLPPPPFPLPSPQRPPPAEVAATPPSAPPMTAVEVAAPPPGPPKRAGATPPGMADDTMSPAPMAASVKVEKTTSASSPAKKEGEGISLGFLGSRTATTRRSELPKTAAARQTSPEKNPPRTCPAVSVAGDWE